MAQEQERLQQIASTFGASDIKIFVGRDKVFPDQSVSDAKVQQLENGLRSPQQEQGSIRVTEANQTIYRSQAGVVTNDVKGVAAEFQAAPSPSLESPKLNYFDLLQDHANRTPDSFDNKFTPEFVNAKLNTPDPIVPSNPKSFGESIDRWVMTEAIKQGVGKDEAIQLVKEQSPYFASLSQDQHRFPKAFSDYANPEGGLLSREFDSALVQHKASIQAKEIASPEVSMAQPELQTETKSVELTPPQPSIPQVELSALSNGNLPQPVPTKDEQIRAAVEPKLVEQMSQSKAPVSADPGGAIVLAKSKAVIPIEPTPPQLEQKMPALVTPPQPAERESLEKALAAANARIDQMQGQLDSTHVALKNLSTQVQDRNLKGWATNTAQKIGNTAQTFAAQAKASVVQWVDKGIAQVKAVSQSMGDKVNQVKGMAQTAVGDVKTAVRVKTIEAKEAVRTKVNDALSPVDSAALTKAADRMINQWGHAGKFEGETFNFQRSSAGEISINTKDGTPVFAKGTVTPNASAKTIAHLSEIPRRVELAQNHKPTPEQTAQQTAKPALAR
jgi:hypothetical protein